MTEEQLLQHGFEKKHLDFVGYYFTKKFPCIKVDVVVRLELGTYELCQDAMVLREIPKNRLIELLDYLDDAEKVAAELKDIKTLLAPVFARWDRQNKNTQ